MGAVRRVVPRFMRYSGEYPKRMEGLTANNYDVTRWLLTRVEWPVYEEVARELASQMTDAVIDEAMHQMPPEWYAIDGAQMTKDLRQRRDGIVAYARKFYEHLADPVDVRGTDRADLATVRAPRRRHAAADARAAPRRRHGGGRVLRAPLPAEGDGRDPALPVRRRRPRGRHRSEQGRHPPARAHGRRQRHGRRLAGRRPRRAGPARPRRPAGPGHEGQRPRVEEPGPGAGPPLARAPELRPLDGADGAGLVAAQPGVDGRRWRDAHGVGLPPVPVGEHAVLHAAVLDRLHQRAGDVPRPVAAQRHEPDRRRRRALLRDREHELLRFRERDRDDRRQGAVQDGDERVLDLPGAALPAGEALRAARRAGGQGRPDQGRRQPRGAAAGVRDRQVRRGRPPGRPRVRLAGPRPDDDRGARDGGTGRHGGGGGASGERRAHPGGELLRAEGAGT